MRGKKDPISPSGSALIKFKVTRVSGKITLQSLINSHYVLICYRCRYLTLRTLSRQHWMVCGPSRQLWAVPDGTGRLWTVSGWLWTVSRRLWTVSGRLLTVSRRLWTVSGWFQAAPDGSGRIWTVSRRHRTVISTTKMGCYSTHWIQRYGLGQTKMAELVVELDITSTYAQI